jgi:adenosylcobinamide kinase/adenosylcobinamide-phosphate guanylyltransferase
MTARAGLAIVLGGARSGKTRFAEDVARASLALRARGQGAAPGEVVYLATARVPEGDDELRDRVERHRSGRPSAWTTLEPPSGLDALDALAARDRQGGLPACVVVDCATLWLAWELSRDFARYSAPQLATHLETGARQFTTTVRTLADAGVPVIVVSNETGSGVVPATPAGRTFRDALGRLNTDLSTVADLTILLVAGNPILLREARASGGDVGTESEFKSRFDSPFDSDMDARWGASAPLARIDPRGVAVKLRPASAPLSSSPPRSESRL